jgi:tellurite resistance protein TerC
VLYIFGVFLVWTGYRMARQGDHAIEPKNNPAIRMVRRLIPVSDTFHGSRFFVQAPSGVEGASRRMATPLFVVLVLVETTDLIFAVDSIPAVFAVTRDPFLVYTSNAFAVLGLRTLYFLLNGVIGKFRHLKYGLSIVLIFVGAKMLLADVVTLPTSVSLGVIASVLLISVATSILFATKKDSAPEDIAASDEGKTKTTQSVEDGIPTQSVGTRVED